MVNWDNRRFRKAVKRTSDLFGTIGGSLTIIMMLTVVREVVGRYLFGAPTLWSAELNCYLLVALAYLGSAYTETVEGHVRMDLVYEKLSGKRKAIADILINMVAMCWIGMLFWQGGRIALHSFLTHAGSGDAMMWPLWPSQLMIPIGTLLLEVVLICKLLFAVSVLFERE